MSNERGPLREISWRDVCPWLILFRTFRLSIGVQVLLLASLGATATTVGWVLSDALFVRDDEEGRDLRFMAVVNANNQWPWEFSSLTSSPLADDDGPVGWLTSRAAGIAGFFNQKFVQPLRNVFRVEVTLVKSAYFLFGGLWALAVWAFFGGAISRIAVMRLGCEERVSLKEALVYACRRFGAYFAAPVTPLIAVALLAVPLVLLGLLMKLDVGVVIAGFLWILVVLDGLVIGVLLLGLLFGWPLMWGTISAEGSDSFDALSRSYNYTFQRPLHYLFYVVLASLFGVLCFYLVFLFSEKIIDLGYWGVSWGSGNERANEVRSMASGIAEQEGVAGFGAGVISVFTNLVRLLAGGFTYAFFWCVASAIYLLLRYNVDQTEFDEVWLEEHEQRYELPKLKPDESGVPQLEKEKPKEQTTAEEDERGTGEAGEETAEQTSSDSSETSTEASAAANAESAEESDPAADEIGDASPPAEPDEDESKPGGA